MNVGTTIRKIRKERGKTQDELATDLEISRSYLSDIENGNKNPSIKVVQKLASKLNVSVNYLLTGNKALSDLSDEEKRSALIRMGEMLSNETKEKQLIVKNNLFDILREDLSYTEIHFLYNVYNFFEMERFEKDYLLHLSVFIQMLNQYKNSNNIEVYKDLLKEIDIFLKKYININGDNNEP